MAIHASRTLETGVDPDLPAGKRGRAGARIDFRDAFYLATLGGGEALGLPIGKFAPGYLMDAVAIDATAPLGTIRLWEDLDAGLDLLQKIVFTASRPNVASVWVGGRRVAGATGDE